jgi:hypothetical protein
MKKILFIILLSIIGLVSHAQSTLTVSTNKVSIATPANSTGTFNINSNTNWVATSSQTWLTVLVKLFYTQNGQNYVTIPYSGSAPDLGAFEVLQNFANGSGQAWVTLTAQANISGVGRTATITVTGTGVSTQIITVTQGTVVPPLSLPATIYSYNKK